MVQASLLILGSAFAAGADTPAAAPAVPAAVVVHGTGCTGCGTPAVSYNTWAPAACSPMPSCDPCAPRVGLFDRLRARLAALRTPKAQCSPACPAPACEPAPVACAPACGTPVFTGFTTSCADPCQRTGLLARLRARFASSKSCDACAAPLAAATVACCSPVSTAPAVVTSPAPTTTAPAQMPPPVTPTPAKDAPKPMEPAKDPVKKDLSISSSVAPPVLADVPRTPVLGGTVGKY